MGTQAPPMRAPAPAGKESARAARAVMRVSERAHEAATASHAPSCVAAIPVFAPSERARTGSSTLPRIALQRKLAIGAVDDPLEHEADRVAEQVMRMPAPATVSRASPLQISRKCAECEEEEGKLQKKSAGHATPQTAPPIVHEVLASPGAPLDATTRAFMEPRFGHDFGRVRVHADTKAAESASTMHARAYTVGNSLVFGAGEYRPGTDAGQRLLGHELTHVVQQSAAKQSQDDGLVNDPLEQEADPIAEQVMWMPASEVAHTSAPLQIRRQKKDAGSGSAAPSPTPAPSSAASGKTARVRRMEKLRDCAYTVTYANQRSVDCETAWQNEKGTKPTKPVCGAAMVYDIVSVTANGSKCPKLEGLKVSENVKGDHGCTPSTHVWRTDPCEIGAGGKVSGCTDTFSYCTDADKKDCTEIVDQEIEVGGKLAEEHEIVFKVKKSGKDCTGKVTRQDPTE